jgi:membrane fusion protein (multidrug efflux system)
LTGHVTAIGGATGARFSLLPPENATGNYVKVVQRIPVRIDLDPAGGGSSATSGQHQNSACLLRPGMSVVPSVNVR